MEIMTGGAIDQYTSMDYHDENAKSGRAGKRYVIISNLLGWNWSRSVLSSAKSRIMFGNYGMFFTNSFIWYQIISRQMIFYTLVPKNDAKMREQQEA